MLNGRLNSTSGSNGGWAQTMATLSFSALSLVFIVMICTEVDIFYLLNQSKDVFSHGAASVTSVTANTGGSTATTNCGTGNEGRGVGNSGVLFKGEKVHSYTGPRHFLNYNYKPDANLRKNNATGVSNGVRCDHWSVVTTIFEPSDAVKKQGAMKGWCLLVIGDKKGPKAYDLDLSKEAESTATHVFLSAADQQALEPTLPFAKLLPWNHFGRKNLGFLQAIRSGAKLVWDFDDDNGFIGDVMDMPGLPLLTNGKTANKDISVLEPEFAAKDATKEGKEDPDAATAALFLNPYPLMGAPALPSWPRGFPLELIKRTSGADDTTKPLLPKLVAKDVPVADIGVVQSLANHDPDVDAIYRLTQPLPFDFTDNQPKPVIVPAQRYSPFNAQATLVTYSALWSLLLPCTIHGRVSDIWRSYFYQRLAADLVTGHRLVFTAPAVTQYRNAHNYLADFDSEQPLYLRAGRLVQQLSQWEPVATTLPGRMEELYVMLYEHGYLGLSDVTLMQAWVQALLDAGYVFPKIK